MRLRILLVALAAGCSGGGVKQPYATPAASAFVDHLRAVGERTKTYVAANNTMDYWLGKERIKTTMHVMGERGAKIRFNGINPQTDNTAADLGCDGTSFTFIDYEKECSLTGVCDRNAIGQLLRVSMEPDDFLLLVAGSTPIIPDPTGTARWNDKNGTWVVDLVSPNREWRQTLVLDGNDGDGGKWEVLESTVFDSAGKVDWKLRNKQFATVKGLDGASFRVAGHSKFEQPKQKADLVVDWADRRINGPPADTSKFQVPIPAGHQVCGQKKSASPAPATP